MSFEFIDKAKKSYDNFVNGSNGNTVSEISQSDENYSATKLKTKSPNSVVSEGILQDGPGDKFISETKAKSFDVQKNADEKDNKLQEAYVAEMPDNITKEMIKAKQMAVKKMIDGQSEAVKSAIIKNFDYDAYNNYQKRTLEEQYLFLSVTETILEQMETLKMNPDIDEQKFAELYVKNLRDIFNESDSIESVVEEGVPNSTNKKINKRLMSFKRNIINIGLGHRIDGKSETKSGDNKPESLDDKIDAMQEEKAQKIAELDRECEELLKMNSADNVFCERIKKRFAKLKNQVLKSCQMHATAEAQTRQEQLAAQFLVDGKHQDEAEALTVDLQKDQEAKSAMANMHTQAYHMKKLQKFAENGDAISSDIYKNMVANSMQYKTAEAAAQYEQDAYEYRQKVENGEIDAPWLTKEHLTAQTTAIAIGIKNNVNMSESKKADLLSRWDAHAKQFDDYGTVKAAYNKEINAKKSQSPTSVSKATITAQKDTSSVKFNDKSVDNPISSSVKISPKELEDILTSNSISVVKNTYPQVSDWEIAQAVLHNPKLKKHRIELPNYLKTLDVDKLYYLCRGCSTETYYYVFRTISPRKSGKLYDLAKSDMCYNTRAMVENVVEESQGNV